MLFMKKNLLVLLFTSFVFFTSKAQTCGSTNLALNRPAVSTASASYEAGDKLVDGNTNAYFWPSDRSTDQWAYIQLAASATICRVVVKWEQYHYGNFKIQVTNTNPSSGTPTWTDVAVVSSNNSPTIDGNVAINDLSIPNNYGTNQYVRLYMIAPLNNNMPEEVEVYGALVNQAPTVSLSSPANNTQFVEGSTIILTANAADSDGSIHKVEFYQGDTWLGVDSIAPYTYNWTNVATGNYQVYCVAYDNQNASTESGYYNIVVNRSSSSMWSLYGNIGIRPDSQFLGTIDNQPLIFKVGNQSRARIDSTGALLINTTSRPGDATVKLAVKGTIYAQKLKVTQTGWADFVFAHGYKLRSLESVELYIKRYQHLPEIPSAGDVVNNGLDVGNNQAALLQKIEELTLYVIELNKKVNNLQKKIRSSERNRAKR